MGSVEEDDGIYEGEWVRSKKEGFGCKKYKEDKGIFYGQWKEDKK